MMTVAVVGLDRLTQNLARKNAEIKKAVQLAVVKGAAAVHESAVKSLRGARTGRVYRGGGRSKRHRASAPGEPPAWDRGMLAASAKLDRNPTNATPWIAADVVAGANYAKHLEFGTTRMRPRPWLAPALRRCADSIKADIYAAVKATP